ncbi:MAG: hypothetical protein AMJ81_12285, partial [Phycisphaerae bacterium SM23_33]
MNIRQEDNALIAESPAFIARFDGPALTSFVDRRTGAEFCRPADSPFPLELFYLHKDTLGPDKGQRIQAKLLSDLAARVLLVGNDSDRELFIRLDPQTGDLCVRPSGRGARRGVASIRWNISFARQVSLILPCVNGILVEADRAFPPNDRFPWPFRWNAQLAIAERDGAALMVHCQDTSWKFKALNLARAEGLTTLGFEAEQVGPLWDNRGAGGVEWRLNAYEGGWRPAASRYRDWLGRTYGLEGKRSHRPDWVDEISFCVCWAPANRDLLDALARVYPPGRTLIHLSQWRTSGYDIDYPDYRASDDGRAFMAR